MVEDLIKWLFAILPKIESKIEEMFFFVHSILKQSMRNPKIYDLLLKDEEKLNYLYNWVTDNPAPSNKEKVHHFTHNAP